MKRSATTPLTIIITMFFCLTILGLFCPPVSAQETEIKMLQPKLQIHIPQVHFSEIAKPDESGYITIPSIGEYIAGIYKYLVGIAGVMAVAMIMYGGMKWIFSGGDSGKISTAKETIMHAVIGLILALGSYLILYTLNPDLVSFKALSLKNIERVDMPDQSNEAWQISGEPKTLDQLNLVEVKGGPNMEGNIRGMAEPEIVNALHRSAATLESVGCTIVYASGHRTGKDQFSNIPNRCQWSAEYSTYVNCRVALGNWGSTEAEPLDTTCKYSDPNTPLPPCTFDQIRHYKAIDIWATPSNNHSDKCGKSNCIQHKCQRELTRAMTSNGACVLLGRDWSAQGKAFEPWHFQIDGESCYHDADDKYNALGGEGI